VDVFTKECLAIELGQSLKGDHVVAVLKRIASERGAPKALLCDNGPEFVGRSLDLWAYLNKVRIDFSRPGKPTDNAHVESFNGRLREECLNSHWFVSMEDAKRAIEAWRVDYNESRPHRALGNQTPLEFALAASTSACSKGDKKPETHNQFGTKTGSPSKSRRLTTSSALKRGAPHLLAALVEVAARPSAVRSTSRGRRRSYEAWFRRERQVVALLFDREKLDEYCSTSIRRADLSSVQACCL
jgi:putative transposase